MVRTTIISEQDILQFSLTLPAHYVGKELEILVFAKDEGLERKNKSSKKVSFTVLKTKGKPFKFNREEANER